MAMPDSLYSKGLTDIEQQLALWDQQYGSAVVSQWLFDVAFFRLYKAHGYIYANDLLTETRQSLKKSAGSRSLDWHRRCERQAAKNELQAKRLSFYVRGRERQCVD
ncbi:MAG: hypothetical protein IH857_07410, partial [Deltaproteobacteria bacterium]|nr:hypothetical protein [Deltaproteobacteria bacterium]